jgi:DNA-binding LacI/PurR family transcriptional regulator
VGYDGIHWPSATSHEAASVLADTEELATATLALINQLVDGKQPENKVLKVKTELIPGTTLGPAPIYSRSS